MNALTHDFEPMPPAFDMTARNVLPDERPQYVIALIVGMFESGVISDRVRANSWLKHRAPRNVREKLVAQL
jgi:hypothetical protein